jgi:NADH:ubiquinone oxidoreductase subunit 4 (subunit M)
LVKGVYRIRGAFKLLVVFLALRFFSTSTIIFYLFFEASLIPIF